MVPPTGRRSSRTSPRPDPSRPRNRSCPGRCPYRPAGCTVDRDRRPRFAGLRPCRPCANVPYDSTVRRLWCSFGARRRAGDVGEGQPDEDEAEHATGCVVDLSSNKHATDVQEAARTDGEDRQDQHPVEELEERWEEPREGQHQAE